MKTGSWDDVKCVGGVFLWVNENEGNLNKTGEVHSGKYTLMSHLKGT